jgi:integrase
MNSNAWRRARRAAGLRCRVHDLKHTFGKRLRAAGVPLETRKVLLGHTVGDITTWYSQAELEDLRAAAEAALRKPQASPDLRVA